MAQQERVSPRKQERQSEPVAEEKADQSKADKLKQDMDALMDEIDEVLVENAEEFVANYVQKGGE